MTYRVLKNGVSQRVGETDEFVDREIGDIIEVSPEASEFLISDGFIELVKPVVSDLEDEEEDND